MAKCVAKCCGRINVRKIMNKTTIILLVAILGITLLAWRGYNTNSTPRPVFELVQRTEMEILPKEVHPLLIKINEKNSKIRNFVCNNIDVKIKKNGSNYNLDGKMTYEKDKNFRLKVSSFFGTELDMGSNIDQFWVWSRRMEPRATMFYADHDDLYKTRLRTPFVPLWIMSALGFREINPDEATFTETDEHLIASRNVVSPTGQPLIKRAYIDKKTCLIVAYYLYDMEGTEITVTQIGYSNNLPIKIYMRWNEEDVIMDFKFNNPKINVSVDDSKFILPDYKNKINMGEENKEGFNALFN